MPINQQVGASNKSEIDWAPSVGIHPAVIREVTDMGVSEYKGKSDRRGVAVVQILDEEVEFDDGTRKNKDVWVFFSLEKGLGKVAAKKNITTLRRMLEGIRGKAYTEADLLAYVPKSEGGGGKKLDLNKLEGTFLTVGIRHDEAGKAKVESFYRWPADKQKPAGLPPYETIAEREARRGNGGGGGYGGGKPSAGDDLDAVTGQTEDDGMPF